MAMTWDIWFLLVVFGASVLVGILALKSLG